jgi:simple sugar transport system permease protein
LEGSRYGMKRIFNTNEFYVALTIILLSIVIGSKSDAYFTAGNLIDLLRSSIEMGIFALGALIVIISGGIDVSFTAIATFSMFATTKLLYINHYNGPVLLAFVISALIGLFLGLINGTLISYFKLPTLIVTLGTSSIYIGFLLTFVGNREISNVPKGMIEYSKMNILKVVNERGIISGLPVSILIFLALIVIVWALLKYTMLGRGIYAIGGDRISAERAGFNITAIQLFIYTFVGFISGIAGMVHTTMMRNSNPVSIIGTEMIIIAAVVLGGARITGGHGTILGTILGLFLVIIMNNSLILLGISSDWQRFVIGLLIIIGTGITSYQSKRSKSTINKVSIE